MERKAERCYVLEEQKDGKISQCSKVILLASQALPEPKKDVLYLCCESDRVFCKKPGEAKFIQLNPGQRKSLISTLALLEITFCSLPQEINDADIVLEIGAACGYARLGGGVYGSVFKARPIDSKEKAVSSVPACGPLAAAIPAGQPPAKVLSLKHRAEKLWKDRAALPVALKISLEKKEQAKATTQREIDISETFYRPGRVVRETKTGKLFAELEYLPGIQLNKVALLSDAEVGLGYLDFAQRTQLMLQLVLQVCDLHRKGIIHYDINGGNVLIDIREVKESETGEQSQVLNAYLTDFGLSLKVSEATPAFSAVEASAIAGDVSIPASPATPEERIPKETGAVAGPVMESKVPLGIHVLIPPTDCSETMYQHNPPGNAQYFPAETLLGHACMKTDTAMLAGPLLQLMSQPTPWRSKNEALGISLFSLLGQIRGERKVDKNADQLAAGTLFDDAEMEIPMQVAIVRGFIRQMQASDPAKRPNDELLLKFFSSLHHMAICYERENELSSETQAEQKRKWRERKEFYAKRIWYFLKVAQGKAEGLQEPQEVEAMKKTSWQQVAVKHNVIFALICAISTGVGAGSDYFLHHNFDKTDAFFTDNLGGVPVYALVLTGALLVILALTLHAHITHKTLEELQQPLQINYMSLADAASPRASPVMGRESAVWYP